MKKEKVQIYVHPSFKKMLFHEAKVSDNTTVLNYTRHLAERATPLKTLSDEIYQKHKKKKMFDFM